MFGGNPALKYDRFRSESGVDVRANVMTIEGTIVKSIILLGLMLLTGAVSWQVCGPLSGYSSGMKIGLFAGGAIGGLIVGLILMFTQKAATFLAPIYALCEGLFLGGISSYYATAFKGIVPVAIMLTVGIFAVMLFAYSSRVIRATPALTRGIMIATGGVCLVYLVSMVLNMFGVKIPYIHGAGPIGIIFSLVVVGIAAFNFILDFKLIEDGAKLQMPKYMEWYSAYGLLVTLVWLYLEVLRLLSKLYSSSDD